MNRNKLLDKLNISQSQWLSCGIPWEDLETITSDYLSKVSMIFSFSGAVAQALQALPAVYGVKTSCLSGDELAEELVEARIAHPSRDITRENYPFVPEHLVQVKVLYTDQQSIVDIDSFIRKSWKLMEQDELSASENAGHSILTDTSRNDFHSRDTIEIRSPQTAMDGIVYRVELNLPDGIIPVSIIPVDVFGDAGEFWLSRLLEKTSLPEPAVTTIAGRIKTAVQSMQRARDGILSCIHFYASHPDLPSATPETIADAVAFLEAVVADAPLPPEYRDVFSMPLAAIKRASADSGTDVMYDPPDAEAGTSVESVTSVVVDEGEENEASSGETVVGNQNFDYLHEIAATVQIPYASITSASKKHNKAETGKPNEDVSATQAIERNRIPGDGGNRKQ